MTRTGSHPRGRWRRSRAVALALALGLPAATPHGINEAIASESSQTEPNLTRLRHFPEGGTIELSIVRQPFHSSTFAMPSAYFMSHTADPEKFPFRLGECATEEDGVSWLSQPEERTYIDVGDAVTFRGGMVDLVLARKTDVRDRDGRYHDIAYHENREDSAGLFLAPGTEYEIHLSGSDAFPETTYARGEAVYLPREHEETVPGYPIVGDIEIPRGRDFVWQWEPADGPEERGLHYYHLIGFHNGDVTTVVTDHRALSTSDMTVWCLHDDTGEYRISTTTIDRLAADQPEGIVYYGRMAARFRELQGGDIERRRLDFYGFYLYGANYRVVDEATGPLGGV